MSRVAWKTLLDRIVVSSGRDSRDYGMLTRALQAAGSIKGLTADDRDELISALLAKAYEVSARPDIPPMDDEFYAYLFRALRNEAIKANQERQEIAETEIAPHGKYGTDEEKLERQAARDEGEQIDDWRPRKKYRFRNVRCAQLNLARFVTFLPHKQSDDSFRKPVALAVHALKNMGLTYREIAEVCGLPRTPAAGKQAERKLKENIDNDAWAEEIGKHVAYVLLIADHNIPTVIECCMGDPLAFMRAHTNRIERWRLVDSQFVCADGVAGRGLRHPDDCNCCQCQGEEIALPGTFERMGFRRSQNNRGDGWGSRSARACRGQPEVGAGWAFNAWDSCS